MQKTDEDILLNWWHKLENDRGSRAELRRAKLPDEIVFCPAYHRLYAELKWPEKDRKKLTAIAGLAAHVKENDSAQKLAQQMAAQKNGNNPLVSSLRFRRILAIDNLDELYVSMIRVIRMLNGRVNLLDMAVSVYWWNNKTKKEWAYSYFEIAKNEI